MLVVWVGINSFMYIKNIVHPVILLLLQQKDDVCFSSIMPAHMLPELLNMVCKMFNNFPAWHERQTFLSIEQIFFSNKTINVHRWFTQTLSYKLQFCQASWPHCFGIRMELVSRVLSVHWMRNSLEKELMTCSWGG